MHWIDWAVLSLFMVYTIWDGTRRGKNADNIEGYLLAGRGMPWWAAGLSIWVGVLLFCGDEQPP